MICGVKKILIEKGFKYELVTRESCDILRCYGNSLKFEIIPIYLRGSNRVDDFKQVKKAVESNDDAKYK